MKRKNVFIGVCILAFTLGLGVYSSEKNQTDTNLPIVNEANLEYFKTNVNYKEIITYSQEDVNNDGEKDLVVIYEDDSKYNQMVMVIDDKEGKYITESVRAPKEDVVITFRDIDSKDEIEIMVSGSKDGSIGYAIYRLEQGKLVDLFGEGMEACC